MSKKLTTEEFIEKAIAIHGDKYDYSLVKYNGYRSKIKIICKKCGKIFEQLVSNHLVNKQGCPNLFYINKAKLTFKEFIDKVEVIHFDRYTYDEESFNKRLNNNYKIKIYCKSCNKYFYQNLEHHLMGEGCPYCMHIRGKTTCKERYGDENYNNRLKAKQTCLEKYGVEHQMLLNKTKEKIKQTKKCKYNNENYNNRDKYKQTCINKYGVEFSTQAESTKAKARETCLLHFGVDHPSKVPDIVNKGFETRKRNGTLNISNPEKYIKTLLERKFSSIKCQYSSNLYPFKCDFYIPELDLYIEYQGNWTHGKISNKKILGPFNENDINALKLLDKWKEKAKISDYYVEAIKTWTVRDPLKRKTAKDNGLNWLEFFTIEEFISWYNKN